MWQIEKKLEFDMSVDVSAFFEDLKINISDTLQKFDL